MRTRYQLTIVMICTGLGGARPKDELRDRPDAVPGKNPSSLWMVVAAMANSLVVVLGAVMKCAAQ